MHPVERLRMVAGAQGEDPALVAQEAATSLAGLGQDAGALVTACRRLVDHQPACGPLWWVAARVLVAADPSFEARRVADELEDDATASVLAALLPSDAVVTVMGWSPQVAEALEMRLDVTTLVVDALGAGSPLVSRLNREGGEATLVPEAHAGEAAARANLLLLEASALGPEAACALAGSYAAAAVACDADRPVWMVAGVGRVVPAPLWEALVDRMPDDIAGWRREEVVPLRLVDQVLGPEGPEVPAEAVRRADCPPVPELTRRSGPSFHTGVGR